MKVSTLICELQKFHPELDVMSPVLEGDFSPNVIVNLDTTDGVTTVIVEGAR